jgi:hypothetical protein
MERALTAKVDAADASPLTPPVRLALDMKLYKAARDGDLEAVIDLLASGASVHYRDIWDHMTPLMIAAYRGHARIVTVLLGKGASAMARTRDGSTSLHLAAGLGHSKVCEVLRSCGFAHPLAKNARGETPMDWAESNGRDPVVEILSRPHDKTVSEQVVRARLVIMLKQHIRLLRWRVRSGERLEEREPGSVPVVRKEVGYRRGEDIYKEGVRKLQAAVKKERFTSWMTDASTMHR